MGVPLDDVDLAAALGRCTGAWSHIEYQLTMFFAVLTGMNWALAAAVFDLFKSTRTQIDAVRRVVKISLRATPEIVQKTNALMTEYQTLANRRNDLAHNPFGWTDGESGSLYLMQKTKGAGGFGEIPWKKRPVTREEIDALTADINAFRNKLFDLHNELGPWTTTPA